MLKNIAIPIILVLALLANGLYIKNQHNKLKELEQQVQIIENLREAENNHLERETDRLNAIQELRYNQGIFYQEAESDVSDVESSFARSRVIRLNKIR